ncbi:MAG: transglutaminase family protein [Gammaproteobacteria bacterium]
MQRNSKTLHAVDSDDDSFDAAIRAHDAAVEASDLDVWIGAEPTFTNRLSESPEWLTDALGASKLGYACHIIEQLRDSYPGSIILRTLGRQYPGEERPRWSLGLYQRRDGRALADDLPADPLGMACSCEAGRLTAFWQALAAALGRDGWDAAGFRVDGEMGLRVVFRCDRQQSLADPATDARLGRASLHTQAVPTDGLADDLAGEGLYLVAVGCVATGPDDSQQPCIELPAFAKVALFMAFIQRVAQAAREAGLTALVWRGFPPPVDRTVAWTTLTPDPAVLEINEAPASSVAEFLERSRRLYALVEAQGLAPYRLQYDGTVSDSGGGGQFTLGGPTPAHSPFFVAPRLMSRMVVYFNRHPALSYWFAPLYVGSFSQSPRADENVLESFSELQVALQHLDATPEPEPEYIWRSLSPFLVDTSGNAHRSELNIEKLWNPLLPGRGCLGLVELRAFRMAIDAESAAAIAAMLRALAAMLSRQASSRQLIEWGSRLHDRFALPFYLRQDLGAVFSDLTAAGLGLGAPVIERLLADHWRHIGDAECAGCRLDVDQAIEFWPLLGDAATQSGGSRLVDASTTRLQIMLRPASGHAADLDGWQLLAGRYRVPLRRDQDAFGAVLIMGLRYRAFVPWAGLHPGLGAQGPIVLTLLPPGGERGLRITLHVWQPQGEAYAGLPGSLDDARRRIRERFAVEVITADSAPEGIAPPAEAMSDYCFDLRRT